MCFINSLTELAIESWSLFCCKGNKVLFRLRKHKVSLCFSSFLPSAAKLNGLNVCHSNRIICVTDLKIRSKYFLCEVKLNWMNINASFCPSLGCEMQLSIFFKALIITYHWDTNISKTGYWKYFRNIFKKNCGHSEHSCYLCTSLVSFFWHLYFQIVLLKHQNQTSNNLL